MRRPTRSARSPLGPCAHVCTQTPAVRQLIADALGGVRARAIELNRLVDLPALDEPNSPRLVLWEPGPFTGLDALRALRSRSPGMQVVLTIQPSHPAVRQLSRYAREGIDDLFLLTNPSDAAALGRDVAKRLEHTLPDELVRDFLGAADEGATVPESYCLRHGYRHLTGEWMASRFGVNRTSLYRDLVRASERDLQGWLSFGRTLHVAYELESTDHPIAVIARRLDFESPAAFSVFAKRHLGVSATVARQRGAIALLKKSLER